LECGDASPLSECSGAGWVYRFWGATCCALLERPRAAALQGRPGSCRRALALATRTYLSKVVGAAFHGCPERAIPTGDHGESPLVYGGAIRNCLTVIFS
jgi:hypothetical protein